MRMKGVSKQMKRSLLLVSAVVLAGCGALKEQRIRAVSNPVFLASHASGVLDVREMDRDLSRVQFDTTMNRDGSKGRGFDVVAIPLTGALIETMFNRQVKKENITGAGDFRKALKEEFVQKQSCFDVFLKGSFGDSSRLVHYDFTVTQGSSRSEKAKTGPESTLFLAVRELLDENLPIDRENGRAARSVIGSEAFFRDIVCVETIDFSRPFSLTVQPRFDEKIPSKKLFWIQTGR